MATAPRHLLSSCDRTPLETRALVERARALRDGRARLALAGRLAAFFFFQPSVRTRLSCEAAMKRHGGSASVLLPGVDTWRFEWEEGAVMDGDTQEHVRELAPVVSRMAHLVGIRHCERIGGAEGAGGYDALARDAFLHAFARFASVPVVNLESNRWHPLQGLADQMTIVDRLPEPRAERYVLSWAWHPRALPVATPHSQLVAACDLGMEVVLLRPPGWELDPEVVSAARARAEAGGGSLSETDDAGAALRGARVVCAKSWGRLDCYGDPAREARAKRDLRRPWLLDGEKMARTAEAFLLHCLPVRRNVVVADEVLDGPRSAVVDEAENRFWTAAAVFAEFLSV